MKPFLPLPTHLKDKLIKTFNSYTVIADTKNNIFFRNEKLFDHTYYTMVKQLSPTTEVVSIASMFVENIPVVFYRRYDGEHTAMLIEIPDFDDSPSFKMINLKTANNNKCPSPRFVKFDTPYQKTLFGLTNTGYLFGWFERVGKSNTHGILSCEGKLLNLPGFENWNTKERVADFQCGANYTLILTTYGRVISTGCNLKGQLGLGKISAFESMQEIPKFSGKKICSIACGYDYSLAIDINGRVYEWGGHIKRYTKSAIIHSYSNYNQKRENIKKMANNSPNRKKALSEYNAYSDAKLFRNEYTTEPTIIETLEGEKIIHVDCGFNSALAITNDHRLFMWGCGAYFPDIKYKIPPNTKENEVVSNMPTEVTSFVNGIISAIFTSNKSDEGLAGFIENGTNNIYFTLDRSSFYMDKGVYPYKGIHYTELNGYRFEICSNPIQFPIKPVDQWMINSVVESEKFMKLIYERILYRRHMRSYQMIVESFDEWEELSASEMRIVNIPVEIWFHIFSFFCPYINWNDNYKSYIKENSQVLEILYKTD